MRKWTLFTSLWLLASACSHKDYTTVSVPSYGPPQALVDQIAPCPGPDDAWTWQPGEYRWTGNRYTWEGGSWVRRPAPEARWKAGVWLPRTYGWTYVPGYWY
jgi:hypothetical protein